MTNELQADELRALRNADSVTFHHYEGRSFIRAHRDARHSSSGYDDYREIHLENGEDHSFDAFEMIHSAKFSEEWRTIVSLLKAGDDLRLHWYADAHTNQLCKDRDLHVDVLRLFVYRWGKKDGQGRYARKYAFEVSSRVTLDNSARMIRRKVAVS